MLRELVTYGFQYGCFLLEAALIVHLVRSGQSKRLGGPLFYVACLLTAGGGRAYVLHQYGLKSSQYGYFYWATDVLLVLTAFVLVCVFFRRACAQEERLWHFLRLMLATIFVLVLGLSLISLSRNYTHLFTRFIIEFGQNLYFTCLVLNTLLYILIQQVDSADDELGLLVCGIGVQFAGPAASLALFHLTSGEAFARSLTSFLIPICTLAMLVIWLYALTRRPQVATDALPEGTVPALAEASAGLKPRLR